MGRRLVAGVVLLGGIAVTFALAQSGVQPANVPPSRVGPAAEPTRDGGPMDKAKLHARVARLRAEVELLQLEHDAHKAELCDLWKGLSKVNAELLDQAGGEEVGAHYARMGAEVVGKAAEFDKLIKENLTAIENWIEQSREMPTILQRRKAEFLRLTTELNQKKIELVELETRLDSAM